MLTEYSPTADEQLLVDSVGSVSLWKIVTCWRSRSRSHRKVLTQVHVLYRPTYTMVTRRYMLYDTNKFTAKC